LVSSIFLVEASPVYPSKAKADPKPVDSVYPPTKLES